MFTEWQIQDLAKRRNRILIPAMFGGVVATLAYFVVILFLRHGLVAILDQRNVEDAADVAMLILILPSFAFFIVPCVLAERYVKRFAIVCPFCSEDITRYTAEIIATRSCRSCEQRIVSDGRQRRSAVFKRYRRIQSRTFLKYWLWAWPALAAFCLVTHWFDPSSLQRCPHVLFVPALIGTVAGGWSWIRTFDTRYTMQFTASMVLFVIGASIFWQSV